MEYLTDEFDELEFWTWCHNNGYTDKDYILNHQAELEEKFLEGL